jgi:hypothetical protein
MLNLEYLRGLFGLCTELRIQHSSLCDIVLEQEILPTLYFKGHVLAATLQQKGHRKPPLDATDPLDSRRTRL